jgi:hypothetical protein
MTQHNRSGNKWTINEILSLQREFELLGWSIDQMAEKHGRTPNAIMFKLSNEGFADYNVLYSNYHNLNSTISVSNSFTVDLRPSLDDSDYEEDYEDDYEDDDEEHLNDRVSKLESNLNDIRTLLLGLYDKTTSIFSRS